MSEEQRKELDTLLAEEIKTPCPYHPAGRNSLFLNPLERAVVIERVEKILYEKNGLSGHFDPY